MRCQPVIANSTGCHLLWEAGITEEDTIQGKGVGICNSCPYPHCLIKGNKDGIRSTPVEEKTVYVQCENCGATETLELYNGVLRQTARFMQLGDLILHTHTCGKVKIIRER